MDISIDPELLKQIAALVDSGQYATPEEVVAAGLGALLQQQSIGGFAPGELDALLATGESAIRELGTVPAEEVLGKLRQQAANRGPRSK
jgi:Arc/MetJ-type ribon-helix-helix transcriptional regulator